MLATAIWLGALALALSGGALALAVTALVRDSRAVPGPVAEETQETQEEQEELIRRGMVNLLGYDPQDNREGEV